MYHPFFTEQVQTFSELQWVTKGLLMGDSYSVTISDQLQHKQEFKSMTRNSLKATLVPTEPLRLRQASHKFGARINLQWPMFESTIMRLQRL